MNVTDYQLVCGLVLLVIVIGFTLIAGYWVAIRIGKRIPRHLLLFELRDPCLSIVASRLALGFASHIRGGCRAHIVESFENSLIMHIPSVRPRRMVLLVVHGTSDGQLYWQDISDPLTRRYLVSTWTDPRPEAIGMWAIGCFTAFHYTNILHASGVPFLGYRDEIGWNFATAESSSVTNNLLRRLAAQFASSQVIGAALKRQIEIEYENALRQIGFSPDPLSGNRLTRLFIEQQLQCLTLVNGVAQ